MMMPARRTIALIAGLIALAILAAVIPSCLQKQRSERAQTRVDAAQTGAVLESGMEASNAQAGIATNDMATGALGRTNAEDIRNAEGSNLVVPDAARAAWLRSICKRKANADRAECRVQ